MNQNSGTSRGVRFSHDVLNVLLYCLLGNLERIGNLFVGPSLSEMFDDFLLSAGQLEAVTRMVCIQRFSSSQFLHGHDKSGVLDAASVRETESAQKDRLTRIPRNTLQFELLPVFSFGSNVEGLDDFSAQLCESCR